MAQPWLVERDRPQHFPDFRAARQGHVLAEAARHLAEQCDTRPAGEDDDQRQRQGEGDGAQRALFDTAHEARDDHHTRTDDQQDDRGRRQRQLRPHRRHGAQGQTKQPVPAPNVKIGRQQHDEGQRAIGPKGVLVHEHAPHRAVQRSAHEGDARKQDGIGEVDDQQHRHHPPHDVERGFRTETGCQVHHRQDDKHHGDESAQRAHRIGRCQDRADQEYAKQPDERPQSQHRARGHARQCDGRQRDERHQRIEHHLHQERVVAGILRLGRRIAVPHLGTTIDGDDRGGQDEVEAHEPGDLRGARRLRPTPGCGGRSIRGLQCLIRQSHLHRHSRPRREAVVIRTRQPDQNR